MVKLSLFIFCPLLFCSIQTMFALSQLMLCLQCDIILIEEWVCTPGSDKFTGNKLCLPRISATVFSVYLVYFKAFQSSREPHCVYVIFGLHTGTNNHCFFRGGEGCRYNLRSVHMEVILCMWILLHWKWKGTFDHHIISLYTKWAQMRRKRSGNKTVQAW